MGTWKEKWSIYEEDYTILGRMLNNPQLSQRLRVWGEDLESHLLGNVYGYCNTWDVFWTLKNKVKETQWEERDMCKALEEYYNDGVAEGEASAVIELLQEMGEVPKELCDKIYKEKDLNLLKDWIKLAAKSDSISSFEKSIS